VLDSDLVVSPVTIVMLALYGFTQRALLDRASVKVWASRIAQA